MALVLSPECRPIYAERGGSQGERLVSCWSTTRRQAFASRRSWRPRQVRPCPRQEAESVGQDLRGRLVANLAHNQAHPLVLLLVPCSSLLRFQLHQ
eukprot:1271076-Amphidinium_carterae.1